MYTEKKIPGLVSFYREESSCRNAMWKESRTGVCNIFWTRVRSYNGFARTLVSHSVHPVPGDIVHPQRAAGVHSRRVHAAAALLRCRRDAMRGQPISRWFRGRSILLSSLRVPSRGQLPIAICHETLRALSHPPTPVTRELPGTRDARPHC